jgi:hypothetical protein
VALGCSTDEQLWFRIALISSSKKAATIFDDTSQVYSCLLFLLCTLLPPSRQPVSCRPHLQPVQWQH